VALIGSATIAVSFGFARYGYGLFVPAFRSTFGLTTAEIGFLGSAGYVAYLIGLLTSGRLTARFGPRRPVLLGCAAAAGGSALIATAGGVPQFVVGVVVAASAPGWAWAPFADAVSAVVAQPLQRRVTAVVSTGTTFGLVVAGPLALFSSGAAGWRASWAAFAGLALAAGLGDLWVLPSRPAVDSGRTAPSRGARPRPGELRLLGQATAYGAVASIYYTYAVDMVQGAGLGANWSALLWTLVGIGGVSGVATGDVVGRIGLRRSFGIALVVLGASIAGLAAAPAQPLWAGAAAVAFGFAYMPLAALLALWSGEVHPETPTAGFTRVLTAMAGGSIVGPLVFGPLAGTTGLRIVFVLISGVALAGLALRPPPTAQPLVRTTRNLASPDIIRS
jgi:predicted MFS family arabinose efflux permease